jgi:hypothetical protein
MHHQNSEKCTSLVSAIMMLLLVITCGCISVSPQDTIPDVTLVAATTEHLQTATIPVPTIQGSSNFSLRDRAILNITRPTSLVSYREKKFQPDIEGSIALYLQDDNADEINGYLRWESVRARTNQSETLRIQSQITNIDTAISSSVLNERVILYAGISGDLPNRIRDERSYAEPGYLICSYDPSVTYQDLIRGRQDKEGYVTMLVIERTRGNRLLFINETMREILLPRGMIWEVVREENINNMDFSTDATPRFQNDPVEKVRLLYLTEHP